MPRRPRFLIDMAYYHVLTRGNDQKNIFHCEEDYNRFLEITITYLEKFNVVIYNYCLMPNHIHILLQVIIAKDLPKFMQGILQVYANYFRKKYNSSGFLFQNRYKSFFIDKESYLLECARYIERNPLRAHLTDNLLEYTWSSYSSYAKGVFNGIVKAENPCYLRLSKSIEERQRIFQILLREERPYDKIVDDFFRI